MRSELRRRRHWLVWLPRPALASFRELAESCLPATKIWSVRSASRDWRLRYEKWSARAIPTELRLTLAS